MSTHLLVNVTDKIPEIFHTCKTDVNLKQIPTEC